jgi:hypothetical protein
MSLAMLITFLLLVHFKRENDKADRREKVIEGRVDFRYTL